MSQRRALDKSKLDNVAVRRRKEWVELDDLGDLCIWEMMVSEVAELNDRAARPAIDPRGGMDTHAAMIYQIMLCCYESDEPGAQRVFNEMDVPRIKNLRMEDAAKIVAAIKRVSGLDPEGVEEMRSFFGANGESKNTLSSASASSSSDASLKN